LYWTTEKQWADADAKVRRGKEREGRGRRTQKLSGLIQGVEWSVVWVGILRLVSDWSPNAVAVAMAVGIRLAWRRMGAKVGLLDP
jgi:hypothetical protein